jgi:spore coat protein U-like protein
MTMKRLIILAALISVIALATSSVSIAAQKTTNLTVSASVIQNCSVSVGQQLTFGNYDPLDTVGPYQLTGTLLAKCTKGTTYRTYVPRPNPAIITVVDSLQYNIGLSAYGADDFPRDYASAVGYTSTSTAQHTINLWGSLPLGQDIAVGNYSTVLTATVEF